MSDFSKDIAKYVIYFLLGIVFTMTWIAARDAQCGVTTHTKEIAVLQSEQITIKTMLKDIATDVKALLIAHGGSAK